MVLEVQVVKPVRCIVRLQEVTGSPSIKIIRLPKKLLTHSMLELKQAKRKVQIIADINDEIDEQIKKGAVDVRSRDMTESDKTNFKKAPAGIALTVVLETTPPHSHW